LFAGDREHGNNLDWGRSRVPWKASRVVLAVCPLTLRVTSGFAQNKNSGDSRGTLASTLYRQIGRAEDAKQELDEYKKYKEMREKLRESYRDMRQDSQE
jgi:hypothetical protein